MALDFASLCLPWRADLIRYATRLTQDRSDAEDIVQDAFCLALRAWPRFSPDGDPAATARGWLFRIVSNRFTDSYRLRRGSSARSGRDRLEAAAPVDLLREMMGVDQDHVLPVVREELSDPVAQALENLPSDYRRIVVLVDLRGLAYREAAQESGVPIGTVMSRLHRGRRMLREALSAHAQEQGIGRDTVALLELVG